MSPRMEMEAARSPKVTPAMTPRIRATVIFVIRDMLLYFVHNVFIVDTSFQIKKPGDGLRICLNVDSSL